MQPYGVHECAVFVLNNIYAVKVSTNCTEFEIDKKKTTSQWNSVKMGGLSRGFLSVGKTRYHYLINYFATIFILIILTNCCDAYFYSEKRNDSGEDRNCFCQVNIYVLLFDICIFKHCTH